MERGKSWIACWSVFLAGMCGCVFASASDPHETVATVGDRKVTVAWLDAAVDQKINSGFRHTTVTKNGSLELRQQVLETLIERELNILGGLDNGLSPPIKAAEKQRKAIETTMGKTRYLESLSAEGLTKKQHLMMLAETALANRAYSEFVLEKAVISQDKVRQAYDSDIGRWRVPQEIQVDHILVEVPANASQEVLNKKEQHALDLIGMLQAGEPFAEIASKYSNDKFRIKGGRLGWIHRGRLLPNLEEALWESEEGSLVGPIRGDSGYHIARVTGRRESRIMSFEEVEASLTKELREALLAEVEARWFADLEANHKVRIFDPEFKH